MSSQLNVDTIVDKAGSGGTNVKIANTSVTVAEGGSGTTNTVQGLMKSYFYINPAGDVTILDSFNLSSMTDSGTGRYVGNISSNMDSANYCQLYGGSNTSGGGTDINHHFIQSVSGRDKATNRYTEYATTNAAGSSFTEAFAADCAIFGDLA